MTIAAIAQKHNVVAPKNARAEMPECAVLIDAIRDVFGAPRGINAHEIECGKKLLWGAQLRSESLPARVWKINARAA